MLSHLLRLQQNVCGVCYPGGQRVYDSGKALPGSEGVVNGYLGISVRVGLLFCCWLSSSEF